MNKERRDKKGDKKGDKRLNPNRTKKSQEIMMEQAPFEQREKRQEGKQAQEREPVPRRTRKS